MEDYEKKYKESLARARKYKNGEIEHELEIGENIMEYVFPELKDSKDERIRKCIIRYIMNSSSYLLEQHGSTKEDAITWLEKQGKNNMGISEATKQELKDNLDKALSKETPESWNEFLDEQETADKIQIGKKYKCIASPRYTLFMKGDIYKPEDEFLCSLMNFCSNCFEPIKDDDQKPVDKVELKFHEGDWVTNSIETVQITGYDIDYGYQVDYKGTLQHRDTDIIEKEYHLWTMQDVKAGSIIAADPIEGIEGCSFSSSFVAIYKERNGEDFDSYCFVGFDGKFCKGTTGHSTDNIHPATKEQRETLFKAMRKAGYEWDAEHKQLNKIEQKSVRSKEDIKMLERIICILDSIRYYNTVDNKQEIPYQSEIDFLKSIKDRYTWKPSVEQLNTLFKYAEQNNKDGSILTSLYQELKKLRGE